MLQRQRDVVFSTINLIVKSFGCCQFDLIAARRFSKKCQEKFEREQQYCCVKVHELQRESRHRNCFLGLVIGIDLLNHS